MNEDWSFVIGHLGVICCAPLVVIYRHLPAASLRAISGQLSAISRKENRQKTNLGKERPETGNRRTKEPVALFHVIRGKKGALKFKLPKKAAMKNEATIFLA